MVFHEPFDAAVFCLQVQLALQHADWGAELPAPHLLRLRSVSGTAPSEAGCLGADGGSLHGSSSLRGPSEAQSARSAAPPAARPARATSALSPRHSSALTAIAQPARSTAIVGLLLPQPGPKARGLFAGPRVRMGVATADIAPRDVGNPYGRAVDLAKSECGGVAAPPRSGAQPSAGVLGRVLCAYAPCRVWQAIG